MIVSTGAAGLVAVGRTGFAGTTVEGTRRAVLAAVLEVAREVVVEIGAPEAFTGTRLAVLETTRVVVVVGFLSAVLVVAAAALALLAGATGVAVVLGLAGAVGLEAGTVRGAGIALDTTAGPETFRWTEVIVVGAVGRASVEVAGLTAELTCRAAVGGTGSRLVPADALRGAGMLEPIGLRSGALTPDALATRAVAAVVVGALVGRIAPFGRAAMNVRLLAAGPGGAAALDGFCAL